MNNNIENNELSPKFMVADSEKIPCKKCKYGWLTYFLSKNCAKYKEKPDSIYYENQPCPFFRETKESE